MSCHEFLQEAMHERGLRMTRQRGRVLDAVHTFKHPATAEEIFRVVAASDSDADITTVYRTLNFLEGFGLITAYDAENGRRRFEHHSGNGVPHFVCRRCGRTAAIKQTGFQQAVGESAQRCGFEIRVSSIVVPGLCPSCRRKRRRR
jgi:Fur family ferric uptake transcriptional regulator